jgi:AraC-like DNA-binding protein
MSGRTLQRRLLDLGTTHREVLDEARRQRAMDLLSEGALSIAEIAYRLGYSEPGALRRSFRRWAASPSANVRASRN